jgi:hypothetical protein
MKIRQSFVSNSSSTSYVVLFPEGATVDNLEFTDLDRQVGRLMDDEGIERDEAVKILKDGVTRLLGDGCILEYDDPILGHILPDLLEDYVIDSIDTGPDAGQVSAADTKKVKKILLGVSDES